MNINVNNRQKTNRRKLYEVTKRKINKLYDQTLTFILKSIIFKIGNKR